MRMDNEDLLFPDQRRPPLFYKVEIQGKEEKTVSIRGGLSWPQAGIPGYFVLVGQLEEKDRDGNLRFLAFAEDQANLMLPDFFERIASACRKWRIDALCHGDAPGEQEYSNQLWEYLHKRKEKYEIIQMPDIDPMGLALKSSWAKRSKKIDFLTQLVRSHIANKTLVLFQPSQNRTPLLFDKLRNVDREADVLDIPEIRALAFVMDDFNLSPWIPPKPIKGDYE